MLSVGYIRRAHGVRGEVVVRLTTNRAERVAPGTTLVGGDEPLVVRTSRPKDADFLVFFEGVNSREAADALRGTELFAEPIDDPDELWVHDLIGSTIVETDGTERGVVVEVHANPASDLLVLDTGALVPLRFVTKDEPGRVTVDVPAGLFELFEDD